MVRVISSACINDNTSTKVIKPPCCLQNMSRHNALLTFPKGSALVIRVIKRKKNELRDQTQANDTYTLFAVKHVAEVFVGFWVFADESEYPFICFVVCTKGYPVKLTVVQHVLENNKGHSIHYSLSFGNESHPSPWGSGCIRRQKHLPNNITHFCLGIEYFHSINGDL